ncbi:MAG: helix-turn-helix domain-containing protein [Rhodobacteraceae bacterium]|nr:helix-turn-helix domain-containing protein [Paracoccaceae bacterium]
MSHAATNWAIQQRGLKPTTKIVLWHLCDRFNPDYGCFPSQERLAHDCEIGRATLNRHLDDLEARGLIRRIRMTDRRTGQQRPTRYLLGFESGFDPSGSDDPDTGSGAPFDLDPPQTPCPDLRHGQIEENSSSGKGLSPQNQQEPCLDMGHGLGHGAVSHSGANPCLKNGDSRVSKRDTNPVREPLSKPVKEEEGPRAEFPDDFFDKLLRALGLDPVGPLPGWWQGATARAHVRRWCQDLGLSEEAILTAAEDSRHAHPEPPDGPKALDRAMQRAAKRLKQSGAPIAQKFAASGKCRSAQGKSDHRPRPSADETAAFYADLVNSERYLPSSMIGNTIRDAMLARRLVTAERLRERGVQ